MSKRWRFTVRLAIRKVKQMFSSGWGPSTSGWGSQSALEYENQALAIYRETGNRSREAHALKNIGAIYYFLINVKEAYESTYAAV
jgi:hypothetical protein